MTSEPIPLRSALARALAKMAEGDVRLFATVWESAVGPGIASRSEPLELTAGVLKVRVEDGAIAAAVAEEAPRIIERLHRLTGTHSVRSLEVVTR